VKASIRDDGSPPLHDNMSWRLCGSERTASGVPPWLAGANRHAFAIPQAEDAPLPNFPASLGTSTLVLLFPIDWPEPFGLVLI
jgi:hypothetical protein